MRFGCFVPQGWRLDLVDIDTERHWEAMAHVARTAESAGYESVWVYDHFHTVPVRTQEPTYEAWTMMAALAVATKTVRLGQMCTCNSYRPPAYLAKVAASIDAISGGRVEMGIGAGWYEDEYIAYGYEFPKPSVRIGMLAEAVEIMRRLWTEDETTFEGKHHRIQNAICSPKPLQDPHIPLWVAGGGERLTLRIVATHGDYSNFGLDVDDFIHKSDLLRAHCKAVGRDFDEITRTTNFNVVIADTEAEVAERIGALTAHLRRFTTSDDEAENQVRRYYLGSGGMVGTPEQIIEKLVTWRDAGVAYALVNFADAAQDTSALESFAGNVMPALA